MRFDLPDKSSRLMIEIWGVRRRSFMVDNEQQGYRVEIESFGNEFLGFVRLIVFAGKTAGE